MPAMARERSFWFVFPSVTGLHLLLLFFGQWVMNQEQTVNTVGNLMVHLQAPAAPQIMPITKPITTPRKVSTLPAPKELSKQSETITQPVTQTAPQSGAALATVKNIYLNQLKQKIEENKFYPPQARRMGQMGIVEVAFTVKRSGHIINTRIKRPSSYKRLDESALAAVEKVGVFRPIPDELGVEVLDVIVPVRFSIQ